MPNDLSAPAPTPNVDAVIAAFGGFTYICRATTPWTDIYVSDGVETVTGYPAQMFRDGEVRFDSLFDPRAADDLRASYSTQLAEKGAYTIETSITRRDGAYSWIIDKGMLSYAPDGGRQIVGVCLDTSFMSAEQQRLKRAEADAENARAFRSRAAAVIAHETRNPLNILSGYLDLIGDVVEQAADERLQRYVEAARKATRQLVQIQESALRYQRVEAPRQVETETPMLSVLLSGAGARTTPWPETPLRDLIDGAANALSENDRAALSIDLDVAGLAQTVVRCDSDAVISAVTELLSNAARHGGDKPTIAVTALNDGSDGAVLLFEDDGPGVKADDLEDAVRPFAKPRGVENVAAPGIGLGLPRVAATMTQAGGALLLGPSEFGGLGAALAFPAKTVAVAPGDAVIFVESGFRRFESA